MAQLSRPYQVVIVLVAVLALAWFTVLHSHLSPSSSGSSPAGSSHSPSAAKAGATERNEGKPTKVYHGSAPGLKGLSKDINRAHEAVATANAQAQKAESGAASATTPNVKASVAQPTSSAHAASPAAATKAHSHRSASHAASRGHARASHSARPSPVRHHAAPVSPAAKVAGQLHDGRIVLLLFWKRSSFADQAVHSQVSAASHALGRKVAADYAKPREVGAFGTVTRNVSVVQTPTLLVIDHKGLVTTITGLTDAFAIEQAVREAER
jgi:hypothetical protein